MQKAEAQMPEVGKEALSQRRPTRRLVRGLRVRPKHQSESLGDFRTRLQECGDSGPLKSSVRGVNGLRHELLEVEAFHKQEI